MHSFSDAGHFSAQSAKTLFCLAHVRSNHVLQIPSLSHAHLLSGNKKSGPKAAPLSAINIWATYDQVSLRT